MVTLSTVGLAAAADPRAVVQGPGYRFTVLTSRLLRLEWSEVGAFVDLPTQIVVNRTFAVPEFSVIETPETLEIWTEHLHLNYDKQVFSPAGLSVHLRHAALLEHDTTWHFGDPITHNLQSRGNLGGTARTLDLIDGACALEPGILATHGYAVVDDSVSVLLTPEGWLAPRAGHRPAAGEASAPRATSHDLYFFGYGLDYKGALRDFFTLTGPTPLIPRYVLGNWWSRYHRYTAEEYLALMDRFAAEQIPFSVAVIDMDWHLVDIDPELGTGWTGYTWNTALFPDPPAFMAALHERGLAVSLNVHPADGVRRHEAAYPDVARDLGRDPATGQEIAFDITSPTFVDSYLTRLHHPQERAGVDFWWLDWQSGGHTRVPGLDPLWMLNHVHYNDSGRTGARPLTFSRYAGVGSHRYPVGFSGDTVVSWASLDFQPYFTATAANVGYYWWSHDIGGHMFGVKDDELATRWYQLGAFSPINRLHSTQSPFNSKEPWRFGAVAERIMGRYLRLRNQLVPYLYSASWAAHTEGVGIARPMYHEHPRERAAYRVPNQYSFGPDLIVAPITTPADRQTHLGSVRAWLPSGQWFDALTGRQYTGGREIVVHRTLDEIPVFARAGAILPLATDAMGSAAVAPDALTLRIFAGASGSTVLIEDDGSSAAAAPDGETRAQVTAIRFVWGEATGELVDAVIHIDPPTGPGALMRRSLTLDLVGVESVASIEGVSPHAGGDDLLRPGLITDLGEVDLTHGLSLRLNGIRLCRSTFEAEVFTLLDQAEIEFGVKESVYAAVRALGGPALIAALHALELPGNLFGALLEIISAG